MNTQFSRSALSSTSADGLVMYFFENERSFQQKKKACVREFASTEGLLQSGDFSGAKGSVSVVYLKKGKGAKRLFLVGLGKSENVGLEQIRRSTAKAARVAQSLNVKHLACEFPTIDHLNTQSVTEAIIEGAVLSVYKFDKYFTINKTSSYLEQVTICGSKDLQASIQAGIDFATVLCEGVYLTRDLANAPNNEIYPEALGERARKAAKEAGFKIDVFNKKKIESLKMGGLLAVNQGSVRPPVFIVMEYNGGKKGDAPVVLVGKGITFDTGGISLKPGAGMMEMKLDMHGSATVIGTMYAVAKLKLPINLVCLVPSTENMPSGSAYVPGDVITHFNGVTSEIDNTDAEGRLVLADALSYADRYNPQAVVDIATLTGACVIALGSVTSGLMGTDDALKSRIKAAASNTSEYVCELPLYEEYEEQIKSDIADVKNSGGRPAGSITAALFLKKFIGNYPWAHLDIAGTGIAPKDGPYAPKGGSGVGVRLFVDMIRNW